MFCKCSKLSIWMCIKSYKNKSFMEMIFHFSLKNDLFHRRGQKMVPIHFCNCIHWDKFLTKFHTFCSKCTIEPFFYMIFLHCSVVRMFYFLGKFEGKNPRIFFCSTSSPEQFFFFEFFRRVFRNQSKHRFPKQEIKTKTL